MLMLPERLLEEPKSIALAEDNDGEGSNHSPTSVVATWRTKLHVPPFIVRPRALASAATKYVRFAPADDIREFSFTPPLTKLEVRELYYTKHDFALFNEENRALAKAVRLCNRTGEQQVRPQVPEVRGLEHHLSVRANLEARGRLTSALTAVFIEQARQRLARQGIDDEAIRLASLKVTRQSLDIALYRGQMDHQRSMLPSPPRFGQHRSIVRRVADGVDDTGTNKPRLPRRTRLDEPQESVVQQGPAVATAAAPPHATSTRQVQRPVLVSQSSLRFRDASNAKDKSPDPPRRAIVAATADPHCPDAVVVAKGKHVSSLPPCPFAVGKPRRGMIIR
jgi:hypothetical protein